MRFHWKKIGLPCLIHIHKKQVHFPRYEMSVTEESTVVADDASVEVKGFFVGFV